MPIYATIFDITRGVDVFRGSKLIAHFDGPLAYELAKLCEAEGSGRYVRYWARKPVEGK